MFYQLLKIQYTKIYSPTSMIAILLFINCSRAEVLEWSGLKPCWSGTGRRYLLMVGRIRVSMTFVAGQRSEMGRYEDPWGQASV